MVKALLKLVIINSLMVVLLACGGSSGDTPNNTETASVFSLDDVSVVQPKTLEFTWTDSDATSNIVYELYENPNFSPGVAVSEGYTQVLEARVDDDQQPPTSLRYRLPTLLSERVNASYMITANDGSSTQDTYPYQLDNDDINDLIGYFKASNTEAGDELGYSVALSDDGRTLAVGAPHEDSLATGIGGVQTDNDAESSGAVYIFSLSNDGDWEQSAYIKASNPGEGYQFGYSVALSDDGRTLAVGAPNVRAPYKDYPSALFGAVYIFGLSDEGEWQQQDYITDKDRPGNFGFSVALSDDGRILAVGSPELSNGGSIYDGAAYIFGLSDEGGWEQQAFIRHHDNIHGGPMYDFFGHSVALSGDGHTLVAGAIGVTVYGSETTIVRDGGAVYVFSLSSESGWEKSAEIVPSNEYAYHEDYFGKSVALSNDGRTLAVGVPDEDSSETGIGGDQTNNGAESSGAVYVFGLSGEDGWEQRAYIKSSNTDEGDNFGNAIALSDDGRTLAVGARHEDSLATGIGGDQTNNDAEQSGAVYIY